MAGGDKSRTLDGRTALVTGSTTGLGLAIADRLAQEGAAIILNGLADQDAAEAARAGLAARRGADVIFHGADLADPAAIGDLVSAARSHFGSIDILVNNAVVRQAGPIETLSPAGWDRSIAVNLNAAFHLIRLILPGMRTSGFGRIVNISSIYGLVGAANRADYVTTKTALIGLTRAVALETAESEITCNAICPGTVPTDAITAKIRALAEAGGQSEADATRAYLAERQPSRRFVDADGVAATVAFLCSPAARDITGVALPIDGAWSAA